MLRLRKRKYNIEFLKEFEKKNKIKLSYKCKEEEIYCCTILYGKCIVDECENDYERSFININKHNNFKCDYCSRGLINPNKLIKIFNEIHNNKYDYKKMDYKGNGIKIIVICKIHETEFEITPGNHKKGHQSCKECSKILRNNSNIEQMRTQDEFIKLCNEKHNFKYDYSCTIYTGCKNSIKIKCEEHGEFEQLADSHFRGHGCSKCSTKSTHETQKISLNEFIKKAIEIYGIDCYDYTNINEEMYNGIKSEVEITCKKHNIVFTQIASSHLSRYCGCNECMKEKQDTNIENKIIYSIDNNTAWFLNKNGKIIKGIWGRKNYPKIDNHKKYALWLAIKLNFKKQDDWYKIKLQTFIENHGEQLIGRYYNSSPFLFLKKIFPDTIWHPYLLSSQVPNGYWKNKDNHIKFIDYFSEVMRYKTPEDWYNTKYNDFIFYGGGSLIYLSEYGSLIKLITTIVSPSYNWDLSKFKQNGYSNSQIQWLEFIKIRTPDIQHKLNNPNGEFKVDGTNYKADGYSCLEKCIYEYNGDYWHGNPYFYNKNQINPSVKKTYGELYENTLKKRKIIENIGYKYISIWDSQWKRGINAIIQLQRIYKNK
jgi:hypothetical protein